MLLKDYEHYELPLTIHIVLFGSVELVQKAILFLGEKEIPFEGKNVAYKAVETGCKVMKILKKPFSQGAFLPWEYLNSKMFNFTLGTLTNTKKLDLLLQTELIITKDNNPEERNKGSASKRGRKSK